MEEKNIITDLRERLLDQKVEKQLEGILEVDFSFIKGSNSRLMIVIDLIQKKNKFSEVVAVLGEEYRKVLSFMILKTDVDSRLEDLKKETAK